MMHINFTHRILQITEIKIQQLVITCSIKLMLIHAADYTCCDAVSCYVKYTCEN
jgi:hypothetical protein